MAMKSNMNKLSNSLVDNIKSIILTSRKRVIKTINSQLIETYWFIGKEIVENERQTGIDSKSARQQILELSKVLTQELGRGFSRSNLFNMRKLYLIYPDVQTLSGQLSWSHICELITIEDKNKRSFYEKESLNSSWSFRELKRQIDSSLYERLILSSGKPNKDKVLELSREGQVIDSASDIVKNPYVFEFLGIPEKKPILEKDLERKLIRHIEDFLLELGRGFMFVGSQQRVTINNTHYYVDMVFYNKILKCYILIELKTTKLKISDGGQLNTYLNYYKTEVNDDLDNPPIGIILCAEKDEVAAEYILGGFDNNVFASKYTYVLPEKEELIKEVENLINE
ncbi:PDDEXK nuclease domain-containing protein [Plebeiibacterium marinum]|uniref:PDDEXK nuclease domain-containing protein n=1 Tax=Plebeiibacterium marinum TaxID=2992111 RepID=A0AAE3MI14_9BACT|nr:PDDEXK nuclease domain-containing protein [Plebeiobacterium marinum]MCW3807914.1 PDDEXK nuclease domain-containing protein [Plebeiobacterium marinum]